MILPLLSVQALLSAGVSPSRWNCHATVTSVIDAMHEDGHFGSLAATIHILPLLAGRHHSHIKELEFACPEGKAIYIYFIYHTRGCGRGAGRAELLS